MANVVPGSVPSVRASVFKVPHHGAPNSWFPGMVERLTRCEPDDKIVFSANGRAHPHEDVWSNWTATGKDVLGTWRTGPLDESDAFGDWAATAVRTVADTRSYPPQDVVVTILEDGTIETG
ncbi:MAG: hypothetical protein KJ749_10455 [Planctomycetes bacterium]|nr:hypothetical protein [Planctomycetota bacterium]